MNESIRRRGAKGTRERFADTLSARAGFNFAVEDAPAVAAAVIPDGAGGCWVPQYPLIPMAMGTGQAIGMELLDHFGVAGVLVHQLGDREAHG